jgi:hypothetical protein
MKNLLVFRFRSPQDHVVSIVNWLQRMITEKYHLGQQEHGGELWAKPGAMKNLEEEIFDLPVYYKTARDQLSHMASEGKSAAEAYAFLYGKPHDQ